jgi:hypothetical protein
MMLLVNNIATVLRTLYVNNESVNCVELIKENTVASLNDEVWKFQIYNG